MLNFLYKSNQHMRFLINIIVTTIASLVAAYIIPGVHIKSLTTALVLSVVLALLNAFLKPILVFFSFPITILTLGLFLLVINACIVLLSARLVDGFTVSGFWSALFFSLVVSLVSALFGGSGD